MKLALSALAALSLASATAVSASEAGQSCPPSLISSTCGCPFSEDPIVLDEPIFGYVNFEIKQSLVSPEVEWLGVQFLSNGEESSKTDEEACPPSESVPFGEVFYDDRYYCDDEDDKGTVSIYLTSPSAKDANETVPLPTDCNATESASNFCLMVFEISCKPSPRGQSEEDDEDADIPASRNLDATRTETDNPTPSPSARPSVAPSLSIAPTSSPAPTTEPAPVCKTLVNGIEAAFCYDGRSSSGGGGGGGGGRGGIHKGYTSCYILAESENCAARDYYIDGETDYERGSDIWEWFEACVESYGCNRKRGGVFKYAKPKNRYVKTMSDSFNFVMKGYPHAGILEWECERESDALGMLDFADSLAATDPKSGRSFWDAPVGVCESESPSFTISPAPTQTPAPECPRPGQQPEGRTYKNDFLDVKMSVGTLENGDTVKARFKITKLCYWSIEDDQGNVLVEALNPEEWADAAATIFGARTVKNGATFTGEKIRRAVKKGKGTGEGCVGDGRCVYIGDSGVDGVKIWQFPAETLDTFANNFYDLMNGAANSFWGEAFVSSLGRRCAKGPPCFNEWDKKTQTTCSLDYNSQTCGDVDFLVDGLTDYERGNDAWAFYKACVESYGCDLETDCDLRNTEVLFWSNGSSRNSVRGYERGAWEKDVQDPNNACVWWCPSGGALGGHNQISSWMDGNNLWRHEARECTESPTPAPTACTDGFLTKPPLNIGVVIDISFSTYETPFDGTSVGDVNGDGASDTILDAEIQAVIDLLSVIANYEELDNSNVEIGLILFETSAQYVGTFKPLDANNEGPNLYLVSVLKSISTETRNNDVLNKNIGFTNFDDALDKAIDYFKTATVTESTTNLMMFLSDGKPNVRGDGDGEPWCPVPSDVDCADAPANLERDGDGKWNEGPLSFCLSGDTGCDNHPQKHCAHSDEYCLGDDVTSMFSSELAELDRLGVERIAVGVGSASDVSKDSALYKIDNNPYRNAFDKEILPRQVMTSDDLRSVLRNLCLENTPNPTDQPSAMPTNLPTTSPSQSPSVSPSSSPSSAPTSSPTPDYCDYKDISFNRVGDDFVHPAALKSFGMVVTAYGDESGNVGSFEDGRAHYYATGDEAAGNALIVKAAGPGPTAISTGEGSIIISLDSKHDKVMRLELFGYGAPMSIDTIPYDQSEKGESISLEPFNGIQTVEVRVLGIYQVIVSLGGPGAIAKLRVCRNPDLPSMPSDTQDIIDAGTPTPTVSPTDAPTTSPTKSVLPRCPADINQLDQTGVTVYDDLPIAIVSQDKSSVTLRLTQTWTEKVESVYFEYEDVQSGSSTCIKAEEVERTWTQDVTAKCMESVPITIVEFYVVDPAFLATDVATVPRCCHPPEEQNTPTVAYSFEVWCTTQCPDGDEDVALRRRNM